MQQARCDLLLQCTSNGQRRCTGKVMGGRSAKQYCEDKGFYSLEALKRHLTQKQHISITIADSKVDYDKTASTNGGSVFSIFNLGETSSTILLVGGLAVMAAVGIILYKRLRGRRACPPAYTPQAPARELVKAP